MDQVDPFAFRPRSREKTSANVIKRLLALLREREGQAGWDDLVVSLQDWLGVAPVTVAGWLDGSSPPQSGGITTALQEGWLRSVSTTGTEKQAGAQPQNLQDALWSAIRDRAIDAENLAATLATKVHSVSRWLYGDARPHHLMRIRLEYELNRVGYWPDPSYLKLRSPLNRLAQQLAAGTISSEESAERIKTDRERLLVWLRENSLIDDQIAHAIEALCDELESPEPQPVEPVATATTVPPTPATTPAEPAATPIVPVPLPALLLDPQQTLVLLLQHTEAYLEHFLRHSTEAERVQLRGQHPELAFNLGNLLAAVGSEEGLSRWLRRSQRGI